MVNATRLAATAKRLIEANGRSVTIYKRARTAADTNKPWRGPADTPADTETVIAAFVPPGGSGFGRSVIVDGSLAQAFDMVALVAATSLTSGVVLEEYSSIVDADGSVWSIANVERLAPGSTAFVYVLRLKR